MSRDGRYIATVSGNIGRNFDATDGRELAPLPETNNVHVAAVSPDGRWVALGANDPKLKDYKVRVFDSASGKESSSHSLLGNIRSLAFSADGRWLAAGSDEGTARVFDAATGTEGARLIHGKKPVTRSRSATMRAGSPRAARTARHACSIRRVARRCRVSCTIAKILRNAPFARSLSAPTDAGSSAGVTPNPHACSRRQAQTTCPASPKNIPSRQWPSLPMGNG